MNSSTTFKTSTHPRARTRRVGPFRREAIHRMPLAMLLLCGGISQSYGEGIPAASSQDVHNQELWKVGAEESRLVIQGLQDANKKLLQEKLDLERRIATISASLVQTQAQTDQWRIRQESEGLGVSLPLVSGAGRSLLQGSIVDVNTTLQMVVINLGHSQGMRHGLRFDVVRDEVSIGHVLVLEVRPDVSGAVIEHSAENVSFRTGDRLILRKETEEKWKSNR